MGVVIARQSTEDGLAQQRNQVVLDVAAGAVVLEIVAGDTGKGEGLIKLSEGQQSGVRGDGGTVKFRGALGLNLIRRQAFSPSLIGCLQDAYAIYLQLVPLRSNYSPVTGKQFM